MAPSFCTLNTVLFGLCIYMGMYKYPRIEEYWENLGTAPFHNIFICMSLQRFQHVTRYLHISQHDTDNTKILFNNVKPLLGHGFETSRKL